MKKHFAWRPHLDRDPLFNPFVPSERKPILDHVSLDEAYGDEVENAEASAAPAADAPNENDPPTDPR
jgi:hypothetical protein